jgi:outer membrane protein insertion porin family
MLKNTLRYILTAAFLAVSALPCPAQQNSYTADTGQKISEVRIKGNRAVSESTILNRIKVRAGDTFDGGAINKEIKRLYAMGYFNDVSVETEELPEGVVVTFTVDEKPVIEDIDFRGNTHIRTGRLKKKIEIKEGVLLDYNTLSRDVSAIRDTYIENGYSKVRVDEKIQRDPETGKVTVIFDIDEGIPLKIKGIEVEGNTHIPDNEIKKYMATKPAFFFLQKGAYDEEKFQSDLDRIRTVYRTKGFLDAKVSSRLKYGEDGKTLYVIVIVDEGKRYLVGDIEIRGELGFPEDQIYNKMRMRPGDPFDYKLIKDDVDAVRAFYYDRGYMNADVGMQHKYDPASDRMDILYNIKSYDEVYVGKVNVIGNTKTKDQVIRRELRVYPGEIYDGEKLKYSKERIYNLGFFEDVYFETVPTDEQNVKDLNVTVKETKTGELSFGGGYSSVDAFIGFAQITQRNFDITNFPYFTGGGQSFTLRAELGSARSNYLLSWTDPWIFDYPYLFGFDVYRQEHDRYNKSGYGYDETRTGGDLKLGKDITDHLNTGLIYTMEQVEISNIPGDATDALKREDGTNLISRITWNLDYDVRDNKYSPTKGFVTGTSLENAGGFIGGDKDFVKMYGYISYYHTLIEKFVLELKLRGGGVQNYGNSDEVPIYERFFAGGANTIRGYRQRGVGPRDRGTNTALGGEAMAIFNAEVTFPIYEKLIKGAVFYDIGNVWEEASLEELTGSKDDTGFKMGAGIGVRVKTPIGPIKLDYGYPLSDNYDDKKEGQFYFSVTHGF